MDAIMAQSNQILEVSFMTHLRKQAPAPPDDSTRYIALTQDQFALVDAADYEWLNQWKWCAKWSNCTRSYYAVRNGAKHETIIMHRVILGLVSGDGVKGDHKDHDTLNNRRSNLRPCSQRQNIQHQRRRSNNTSGYKGVYFCKPLSKWAAMIQTEITGSRHLGYFYDAIIAARAYDAAALAHFGEFAVLNFPIAEAS